MYLADHLSRAPLNQENEGKEPNEFQVFETELESMSPFDAIKLSSERLVQLQTCTAQDPVLMTFKTTVITGWPELRCLFLSESFGSTEIRSLCTTECSSRITALLFPSCYEQRFYLEFTHLEFSHLGAESCLRKVRDVFWPVISNEIKESLANCQICADFQARNPRQPLQTHKIPDRPWSSVAADLFSLHGKNYIVLVDYYSNFLEVSELPDTAACSVIQFLKEQFSHHRIPDCLVTDNGSQIVSKEFTQFTTDWEFKHVTSSTRYPKSNGKAESAVKVAKNLLKKAIKDGKDPWSALLNYRNTPTEGMKSNPTQRLASRRTRTLLPMATSLLHPKVVEGVEDQIKQKKQKAKYYHDRTAKLLPEIEVGQEVRVAPTERSKPWKSAMCVQKLPDHSYLVRTSKETVRRNRQSVKPTSPAKPAKSYPMPPSHVVEETVQISPEATSITCTSPGMQHTPTEIHSPNSSQEKAPVAPVTRTRTRVIKSPSSYQDFVKT